MKNTGGFLGGAAFVALILAIVYGYIYNIVWLVTQDLTWTTEQALSAVGIVLGPLGIIMGWLH